MAELDHGAKLALQVDPGSLLALAWGRIEELKAAPNERVSARSLADATFFGRLRGEDMTFHVEVEAQPASDSCAQAARYSCGLYFQFGRPVRTTIVYLHPGRQRRRPHGRYRLPVGEGGAWLSFHTIALWRDLDAAELLSTARAGLLPYVGLARGGNLERVRRAAAAIERLPLDRAHRSDLQAALCLLSTYRYGEARLRGIISQEVLMQSPGYVAMARREQKKGRAKGRAKGRLQTARRIASAQLAVRLGPATARRLTELLKSCKDPERIEQVALLLADPALSPRAITRRITTILSPVDDDDS